MKTTTLCIADWQGTLNLDDQEIPATVKGPVHVEAWGEYGHEFVEYDLSENRCLVTYDGHELLEEDERYEEIIEALHESEDFDRHLLHRQVAEGNMFIPSEDTARSRAIERLTDAYREAFSVEDSFFDDFWNEYAEYIDVPEGDFEDIFDDTMGVEDYPLIDDDRIGDRDPFLRHFSLWGIGREDGERYLIAEERVGYPLSDGWVDWDGSAYFDHVWEDSTDQEIEQWAFEHVGSHQFFSAWANYYAWAAVSGRDPANEQCFASPAQTAEEAFMGAEKNLRYLFSEYLRDLDVEKFHDVAFEWTGKRYRVLHNGTAVPIPIIDNNQ